MKPFTIDELDRLDVLAKANRARWTGSDNAIGGKGTACFARTPNLEYHPEKKMGLEPAVLLGLTAMARDSLTKDAEITQLKTELANIKADPDCPCDAAIDAVCCALPCRKWMTDDKEGT